MKSRIYLQHPCGYFGEWTRVFFCYVNGGQHPPSFGALQEFLLDGKWPLHLDCATSLIHNTFCLWNCYKIRKAQHLPAFHDCSLCHHWSSPGMLSWRPTSQYSYSYYCHHRKHLKNVFVSFSQLISPLMLCLCPMFIVCVLPCYSRLSVLMSGQLLFFFTHYWDRTGQCVMCFVLDYNCFKPPI